MENPIFCRSKVTVKVNEKEITKFFEDYEKGEAFKDFLIYYIKPSQIKITQLNFSECKEYEHRSSYEVAKKFLRQEGFSKMNFDYDEKGLHHLHKNQKGSRACHQMQF